VFRFWGRLAPCSASVAVALEPVGVSAALPRVIPPVVKMTSPEGGVVPLAAFTATVNWVVALWTRVAEPVERVVVVAIREGVTVAVTEPVEPVKFPAGTKVATIVFAPDARLDPLTVIEAVEAAPVEEAAEIVPRAVFPSVKATVPVGLADPEADFTVAVIRVLPEAAIAEGAAVRTIVVGTGGADNVIVTVPEEDAKPVAPP
jgi:hypothetical protein